MSPYSSHKIAQRFLKHVAFPSIAADLEQDDQQQRQQPNQHRSESCEGPSFLFHKRPCDHNSHVQITREPLRRPARTH